MFPGSDYAIVIIDNHLYKLEKILFKKKLFFLWNFESAGCRGGLEISIIFVFKNKLLSKFSNGVINPAVSRKILILESLNFIS